MADGNGGELRIEARKQAQKETLPQIKNSNYF